jgi:hypothetical protein
LGEISQETNNLSLEIYSCSRAGEWWELSLDEFQDILDTGKKYLLGIK